MEKEKLLLIDGHSILSRAFYGMPPLTDAEGRPTGAVYGFLTIVFRIMDEEQADHLAVAFDLREPTFRHKMYAEYKGTRKPMPEELLMQVPVLQELLRAMQVPILTLPGYEADDILGTVAKRLQSDACEVKIVSGDRDLLQLADSHIQIRIPKTARGTTEIHDYYPADVEQEYEVTPQEFIDVKALQGDASDNIPGVAGIGEKTATAIIRQYHSIEEAYAHVDELKPARAAKNLREQWEQAKFCKMLATIDTQAPVDFSYEDAKVDNMYNENAFAMMKQLGFKSLLKRFEGIDATAQSELSIASLKRVDDQYLAKVVFKDARNCRALGFCLMQAQSAGLALLLALDDERLYLFQDFDFAPFLRGLLGGGAEKKDNHDMAQTGLALYTLDLKTQLHLLELPRSGRIQDLAIAAYLMDPLKDSYACDDLARDYLHAGVPGAKELTDTEAFSAAEQAAAYTALVALKAGEPLSAALEKAEMGRLYREIEMPLVYSLYEMERAGVLVDRAALKQYGDELKVRIAQLVDEIYEDCGESFNLNSPQQLGRVLFEKLGLKGGKKTKTGYSTAADVLEKLAEDNAVVAKILEYRTLSKLNSTYAEGLMGFIADDGRIHGRFNQTVTATGRISSADPNLQNIPVRTELGRQLRKVFVPKPGCVFIDADYSQVELRILASLSGDERLIGAYRHADDIHAVTASEVFHVPLSEVTPELRRKAKAVNFGIVYGISGFGLSEGLGISRKEAKEYIDRYFEIYPAVKRYLDGEIAFAKEQGYVRTLYGRRRPVPELKSSNFMQRSFGERVAMNAPIQGTAADIMKKAMNEVDAALAAGGFSARIVLQVHDELLVEAPREEAAAVKRLLVEHMQGAAQLAVELVADAKEGESWYEAH